MLTPTEFELQHLITGYDPAQAHAYYELHKQLKGRRPAAETPPAEAAKSTEIRKKTATRNDALIRVQSLELKLQKLDTLIQQKLHKEASENRKSKAKAERAAKEKDKPASAAEKAEAARESKTFRAKHQQELKTKSSNGSSGGDSTGDSTDKGDETVSESSSVAELKALSTKIKGRLAVAKQNLAAL